MARVVQALVIATLLSLRRVGNGGAGLAEVTLALPGDGEVVAARACTVLAILQLLPPF